MRDEHIDYNKLADEVFYYFEGNIFERERDDVSRDFELVCAFGDWLGRLDVNDLVEIVDIDMKDPDDVSEVAEKLINIMHKGVDKYLGNPFDDLTKKLGGTK